MSFGAMELIILAGIGGLIAFVVIIVVVMGSKNNNKPPH